MLKWLSFLTHGTPVLLSLLVATTLLQAGVIYPAPRHGAPSKDLKITFAQVIDPDRNGKGTNYDFVIIDPDRHRVGNPRTPVINPCLRLNPMSGKIEWDDRLCPWRRR